MSLSLHQKGWAPAVPAVGALEAGQGRGREHEVRAGEVEVGGSPHQLLAAVPSGIPTVSGHEVTLLPLALQGEELLTRSTGLSKLWNLTGLQAVRKETEPGKAADASGVPSKPWVSAVASTDWLILPSLHPVLLGEAEVGTQMDISF